MEVNDSREYTEKQVGQRTRSSYFSETQQQSKRPWRASCLSYQEPAIEDEETE